MATTFQRHSQGLSSPLISPFFSLHNTQNFTATIFAIIAISVVPVLVEVYQARREAASSGGDGGKGKAA
jgi:hypothetical protein